MLFPVSRLESHQVNTRLVDMVFRWLVGAGVLDLLKNLGQHARDRRITRFDLRLEHRVDTQRVVSTELTARLRLQIGHPLFDGRLDRWIIRVSRLARD